MGMGYPQQYGKHHCQMKVGPFSFPALAGICRDAICSVESPLPIWEASIAYENG
jgi:hypothetical protein